MTKAAIFVRVSKQSQDYERQIHDLTAYAERQGYTVVKTIAEKVSGAKSNDERHGITELLSLAASGGIQKVLVTEVSRLGRRTSEVLRVLEELSDRGVSVYAQNYNLETLTPDGKRNPIASLLFTLLERETLVERINSGLAEARRKGKTLGRPIGTAKDNEQFLKENAPVVRLLKQDFSYRQVAKLAGVSVNTVRKVKSFLEKE